jgi:hypothetical protein
VEGLSESIFFPSTLRVDMAKTRSVWYVGSIRKQLLKFRFGGNGSDEETENCEGGHGNILKLANSLVAKWQSFPSDVAISHNHHKTADHRSMTFYNTARSWYRLY